MKDVKTNIKTVLLVLVFGVGWLLPQCGQAFYNPGTGRWISRDPIVESGGKNLYALAANEPIGHTDFLGMLRVGDENWPPSPFPWPWQGCCNGQAYNRFTHCCCKGKVVAKEPVETGIQTWKWVSAVGNPANPNGAPDMHWWLTWPGGSVDANAINSGGGGGVNGPIGGGSVSSPAAAIGLGMNGNATAVKLSPCSYDFDKLIACLARKAAYYAAKGVYSIGNCEDFVSELLRDCEDESKGCTVK